MCITELREGMLGYTHQTAECSRAIASGQVIGLAWGQVNADVIKQDKDRWLGTGCHGNREWAS